MLPSSVETTIMRVVGSVEAFNGNGEDVKSYARTLAGAYLKQKSDLIWTLFPRDVAMGAILLACEKLGPKLTASGLARASNEDLIAWPDVANDMRLRLQDML
jgi:hypothetical protein